MNFVPVLPAKAAHDKRAKVHLRREVVSSKTLCGRAIPTAWQDIEEQYERKACVQCLEVEQRLLDWDNEERDDPFADAYGAGGDRNEP